MTFPGDATPMPTDPTHPTAPAPEAPLVPPAAPFQQPHQPAPGAAAQASAGYPYGQPGPQPYGQPAGYSYVQQPALTPPPEDPLRKARTALGWAIGAAVAAGVALLTAVVAMIVGAVGSDPYLDDSGFYESIRGEVVALPEGSALSGDRLEAALGNILLDYYDEVDGLTCPDTASVRPSTTVVCTAEIDTYPWTGVVFFEDAEGSFVVLEL